ncbi:ATP-binding cassette domain-containing protein [Leuconostoc sp. MS02]|uniref:ATP-binding cassette domain-containing protein n=1 Tax=Leuconostoc aquikimchii TaxID=3236804 RepID=A0ABV3S065_9LACO
MIEVNNITITLKKDTVLKEVSYAFESGKIYGLRGRNGAGKTMLLRALAGLIPVKEGQIKIDDQVLGDKIDFPPSMGLLIENNNLAPEFTLTKNLQLLGKIKKVATDDDIATTITRVGLDPKDTRKVAKFSLGMKQRGAIAQALFEKPMLILLDEPTNAIDQQGVIEIRELLAAEAKRGATIILASHNPEDLSVLADEIIDLSHGEIVKHA